MSLKYKEIADGIKSGKYWHTKMMSESDQSDFRYLYNFATLVHSSSIQISALMEENKIVAFLGNMELLDSPIKVNGLPIFSSHQSLTQHDMDEITKYLQDI